MFEVLLWSLRFLLLLLIYLFIARFLRLIVKDIASFNSKAYSEDSAKRTLDKKEKECSILVLDKGDTKKLQAGETFSLKQPLNIGRDETNDLIIDIPYVSGIHARVSREDSSYFISDLESRNGTFLNGEMLKEKAMLKNSDLIQIGNVLLRFEEGRV